MLDITQTGKTVKTTCPYCGVGCGVLATPLADGSVDIKGDPDHPANFGRLCSKGSALGETLDLSGRLLHPEVYGNRVDWDIALDLVATKFKETIKEHGKESVAFYVSGQLLTEDYYVANKLMKGFIGSANIDTNSRLCMSSSVAGHKRAFGSDTVPGTYEDLELADLIIIVGSNLAWCHPVIYQRIAAAKEARPEMKVVLIDPRKTMTADIADLHLAIEPDGDVALFQGLLAYLANNGHLNTDYINRHTTGFEEAMNAACLFDDQNIADHTGLTQPELATFYELFAKHEKTVTVYSQGVNQSVSGTDKVNSILNCHLATGRIGQEGMGPFSITGQPNAMGGREVGGLANMLACHMDIENSDHREIVQEFWNSPMIPDKPGLKAVDMFNSVMSGEIKAIWIMATNPVDSMPDADLVKAALQACPLVVVSDIQVDTDTSALAHIKFPSLGWGEKDGLVTNSERRISHQKAFLKAPENAKPDWWQLSEVARRMGYSSEFPYKSSYEIAKEFAALSAFKNSGSRDFDIGGLKDISQEYYEKLAPVQWPIKVAGDTSDKRFFTDGGFFTPDGKAKFQLQKSSPKKPTSEKFPLTLNTGRVRDHWHTMTRTGKSPGLSQHMMEPFVEIHPDDAKELHISERDLVEVSSEQSLIVVRAHITDRVQKNSVFVPIHWNDQFASRARVDALVPAIVDPYSGQPALKNSNCQLRLFETVLQGFVITKTKPVEIRADYWAAAKCDGGWRVELALKKIPASYTKLAANILGMESLIAGDLVTYRDTSKGEHRFAAFESGEFVGALYLSRRAVDISKSWATTQLGNIFDNPLLRYTVTAGRPPADTPDTGSIVCSCFSVGCNQIQTAITEQGCATVKDIGEHIYAGTNCGSCRSEIQELINLSMIAAE
ncbi:nitrate reductase [Alphaproteobacteria bacterium 46_93_T64]|nr:nitrate reductase [Alphaproteobacteria bacterium 46_93_T64]